MKQLKLIGWTSLGMATLFMWGCSKEPKEMIDHANNAIQEAIVAGAELYLPDEFLALQDSLNNALYLVESQESKIIRNYNLAEQKLESVIMLGQELVTSTEARKEAIKGEIMATMDEAIAIVETNRRLIKEAPRSKDGSMVLYTIGNELTSIEESLLESRSMMEKGEYLATLKKVRDAREEATSINKELQDANIKYRRNAKA
jgi:hypothetical protein